MSQNAWGTFPPLKKMGHKAGAAGRAAAVLLVSLGLLSGVAQASPAPSLTQLQLRDIPPDSTSGSTPDSTPRSSSPSSTSTPQPISSSRFSCQYQNGDYTVMYSPISQPGKLYPWATPSTMGGGWTPERRCNEISRRLESYRPDGLEEMRTAMENGYNTICVTSERVPDCRIVLTVPPGEDPTAIRDRVFSNLTVADSGQQTSAVNTFAGGDQTGRLINQLGQAIGVNLSSLDGSHHASMRHSGGIDLRPFLDRADGGTGTRLR